MKKDLANAYDINKIVSFEISKLPLQISYENDIKYNQIEADKLEQEIAAMKSVEDAHGVAFKEIDATSNAKKRQQGLKSEIKITKNKIKSVTDELNAEEKQRDKEREQIIQLEEKCRKLNQLFREHNKGDLVIGQTQEQNTDEAQLQKIKEEVQLFFTQSIDLDCYS